MQIQCHQIELLAIVESHQKSKRDTKGPTYLLIGKLLCKNLQHFGT